MNKILLHWKSEIHHLYSPYYFARDLLIDDLFARGASITQIILYRWMLFLPRNFKTTSTIKTEKFYAENKETAMMKADKILIEAGFNFISKDKEEKLKLLL